MKIPLDLKSIRQAAADADALRNAPVSVTVLFDPDSPLDVQRCILNAFQPVTATASVTMRDYPDSSFSLEGGTDLVVLVAGFSEDTGALAASVRQAGVPVLVVTTMPEIVIGLAELSGNGLSASVVVVPEIGIDGGALPDESDLNLEPYPLTVDRAGSLLSRTGEWIIGSFKDKRLAFAAAFPFIRKPLVMDFVSATAVQNAAIGLVAVIPGADLPIMTLNQAKMVLQIAAAYNRELGSERALELVSVAGGSLICRGVARRLVSLLPGLGWAVRTCVAYAGTAGMGCMAVAYFDMLEEQGADPIDVVSLAKGEIVRVQQAVSSAGDPADRVGAAIGVLAEDAGCAANAIAEDYVPAVRSVGERMRDGMRIDAAGIADNVVDLAVSGAALLMPGKRDAD